MNIFRSLTAALLFLSLSFGSAFGQDDKAKKQAEIRKATQASLQKFYKADAKLRGAVEKAPGYGVFTTYGISFFIGAGLWSFMAAPPRMPSPAEICRYSRHSPQRSTTRAGPGSTKFSGN